MSGGTGLLWRILRERTPIAVIYFPELKTRELLLEEAELMAPSGVQVLRATDIEAAFRDPEAIVLLTPDDEVGAIDILDRRREDMVERSAPVVLFLLSDGSGEHHLPGAFALASWLRGREYDPTRSGERDPGPEAEAFEQRTGRSPADWLSAWRSGSIADTLENNLLAHEALLLVSEA